MGMLFKDLEEEQTPAKPKAHAKHPAKQATPQMQVKKEDGALDPIVELKGKLALVIEKVKSLKEEKIRLESRVLELEGMLSKKDAEIKAASMDKHNIREQINELLNELESIQLN